MSILVSVVSGFCGFQALQRVKKLNGKEQGVFDFVH